LRLSGAATAVSQVLIRHPLASLTDDDAEVLEEVAELVIAQTDEALAATRGLVRRAPS
jgi:hypothetical protein